MTSRKGKMRKWDMVGGSSTWIGSATFENIKKIFNFLKEKTGDKKYNKPKFGYSQISKALKINKKQVQFACQKMAFRIDKKITIHAEIIPCKSGIRTTEKVELISSTNEKPKTTLSVCTHKEGKKGKSKSKT